MGVSVGVGVAVGVSVGVAVGVSVGVAVAVGVSVGVAVGVAVGTGVCVGVAVGVAVGAGGCGGGCKITSKSAVAVATSSLAEPIRMTFSVYKPTGQVAGIRFCPYRISFEIPSPFEKLRFPPLYGAHCWSTRFVVPRSYTSVRW